MNLNKYKVMATKQQKPKGLPKPGSTPIKPKK